MLQPRFGAALQGLRATVHGPGVDRVVLLWSPHRGEAPGFGLSLASGAALCFALRGRVTGIAGRIQKSCEARRAAARLAARACERCQGRFETGRRSRLPRGCFGRVLSVLGCLRRAMCERSFRESARARDAPLRDQGVETVVSEGLGNRCRRDSRVLRCVEHAAPAGELLAERNRESFDRGVSDVRTLPHSR